ncbi:MAG: patatin-like phospholipase family protein [Bacteroidota bacterium]
MSHNVALVLSSGGARGVAHIGVIEELIKSGYNITSVAGASMGAMVGGMYARGILPGFTEWLLGFTKMDVIKFMDITTDHGGMIKGEKILKALGEFIGDANIEDLAIPYACVAADLIGRKEVVFTQGSLLQAVRASSSIPTVFMPVKIDGMMLVDGGVLNPLPLDLVHRIDGDILVAVNVNANIPYEPPLKLTENANHAMHYGKIRASINQRWSGLIDQYVDKYKNGKQPKPAQVNLFDIISDSINLAQNKAANIYIEKYKPEIVINISHNSASVFDFYKSEELIEAGRIACREALDKI